MGIVRSGLSVVVGCVLLAGCAQAVSGSPQPDTVAAEQANAAAYEAGMKAFREYFGRLGDEKAKVYNYYTFGDRKFTNEFESAKLGDPPAIRLLKRRDESDDGLVIFHPAGSDVDYVKLDKAHAGLAPTPWVAVPTDYPKERAFDPRILLTSWLAVHLDKAISQTKLVDPDGQPRQAKAAADGGYELHTGATLGTMMEEGIASVPDEYKDQVTPKMKATVLPVRMDFGPGWRFRGFEVRATVPGEQTQLQVQLGYEVGGRASTRDFPPIPQATEVTAITDKAAADKFHDDLNASGPR